MEFYKNALKTSFIKILTDEAVNSWKYNIQHCILMSCGKLLNLVAIHIITDNIHLLDTLAIVFDPHNKFNNFNATRKSECFGSESVWGGNTEHFIFARVLPEPRNPYGWLVDLINRFGQFGGFLNILKRFNIGKNNAMKQSSDENLLCSQQKFNEQKMTLTLISALLRPFGQCYEFLTAATVQQYFKPIWIALINILERVSDDEVRQEVKPENKNDCINNIVKSVRRLASTLVGEEKCIRDLETFRLKIILRLLQVSSFNGKMNALNEVNKVVASVSYLSQKQHSAQSISDGEMYWLTTERLAVFYFLYSLFTKPLIIFFFQLWIKESDVLGIVLRDSLHQPQYVEKLEKIIRFLIKEHALSLQDLDNLWRAQCGKHEAIVKNVHDLLAKLAWDFSPEQLDHLFESFQVRNVNLVYNLS